VNTSDYRKVVISPPYTKADALTLPAVATGTANENQQPHAIH
jgi:hypothetical protein